jgi:hypothetical protein
MSPTTAAPDPPGIEPSASPASSSPPSAAPSQTDYLSMDQTELSERNRMETQEFMMHSNRKEPTPSTGGKSLLAELLEFVKKRPLKKKVLTVVIVVSSISVFIDLIFFGNIQNVLIAFLEWMVLHTALAVFAFIAIFVVSTRK